MFGAGCYFAEDPEKIDQYVRPDPHHNAPGLEELHSRLYTDGNLGIQIGFCSALSDVRSALEGSGHRLLKRNIGK